MKYSREFMKKFGPTVHHYKLETNFIRQAIYWCIDWRYRKMVNVSKWFKNQLDSPSDELIELADKKPGLSDAERKVKEKLQESLDISEEFISKEEEDVEKEIKIKKKEKLK